ncbi:anion permease [Microbacterium betulae]|uniref:Anion permease n=1 Tax=Microbacterium betulae TaxID=2981139 RepID=A0AA97I633_9MICO|nr:anion permease [Microbacterium sp. AB]WOF24406.1 anion permease [Microbacterium sp. AB]
MPSAQSPALRADVGTRSPHTPLRPVKPLRLAIPLVVGAAIWLVPAPAGVSPDAWHLFAIFAATIVGVIAKPLPMGAVTILGLVATLATGVLEPEEALSGFSNTTIWLIVVAFFISRGVIKTGLGSRLALFFVAKLGRSPLGVAYGLAATDLVLAPATPSNTARAGGIIQPIVRSISSAYGSEPGPSSRRVGAFLTTSAFHVNAVTSAMFLTAMAGNPLAAQLAGDQGVELTWGLWALAALVPGLVSLIVVPLAVRLVYPPELTRTPEAAASARRDLGSLGRLSPGEIVMTGTIVGLLALWTLGDAFLGITATTTALIGLVVLLVTGVLTWDDIKAETQAWDTLVWFAVLVMMATQLNALGLIPWLSGQMSVIVGGMGWTTAFILLSLVYFFSHYLFASNTAHISAMYAAFLATAILAGAPPVLAALVLGFISSLFASVTHYSSGPAPVLFGAGYVPVGAWWRTGFLISLVNIAIWMGIGGVWTRILGLW